MSLPWRGRLEDVCRIVQSDLDGYLSLDGAGQLEHVLEPHLVEIDNHAGKIPLIGSRRYLHLTPRWCGGKLEFTFPVEQAQSEVFYLDFPLQ